MISEATIIAIAKMFCGDTGEFYSYKSGPELVAFFNQYYQSKDIYGQGFPSRWRYTADKIFYISSQGRIDQFLNMILSKQYIIRDKGYEEIKAIQHAHMVIEELKRLLKVDGYNINKQGDKYIVVKEDEDLLLIGSGGFANVYKQQSTGLILKKLKEDYLLDKGICSRFKREYEITKSLGDINGIIKVYDFDKTNYTYTMEEAEMTLEKYLRSNQVSEEIKIKCIRQILNVMSQVHKRNIIHRDISCNNVFIIQGVLKVADFGLGKDLQIFNSHQTMYTNSFGQIRYCAPEQFMMLKEGDKRSDVFSLGRLINFILTKDETNTHHFLRVVVEKATNQNAAFRYANAEELLKFVEKSIKYYEEGQNREIQMDKLKRGILDADTETFIYEMSGEDICREIIMAHSRFSTALLNFMKLDDPHAEYIIQVIEDNFRVICTSWDDYDPIGYFTNSIINSSFSFAVKEVAAGILRYVAFDINRYGIQSLVEQSINKGIEPLLEEILGA